MCLVSYVQLKRLFHDKELLLFIIVIEEIKQPNFSPAQHFRKRYHIYLNRLHKNYYPVKGC